MERIEQRPIHSDEVYSAKEIFLVDSGHLITPLTSWNGEQIADGLAGISAVAFGSILELDRIPREGCSKFTEVPYGYVTGMRSQLV